MDYYQVLGISKTATEQEIRKAYRKLAAEYHPDRKPGDKVAETKFKEIQNAYEVLGDPQKRAQFDRLGPAYEQFRQAGGPAGGGAGGNPFQGAGGGDSAHWEQMFGQGGVDLGDLFGDIFSGGGGGRQGRAGTQGGQSRTRGRKGEDLNTEITIPFNLAIEGGKYSVDVRNGKSTETLEIKIPQGLSEGAVIRLSGQGNPGMGSGKPGDLLIKVHIASHPWFKRDGNDLYVDVPVTFPEAALGTKVEVPTLSEGNMWLTIPPGTSSGAKLRLKGKGVFQPKSQDRGDQYVVLKILSPKNLDPKAKQLLEEYAALTSETPRQNLWS
jgi:DnaJ-class molecular chaperone